MHWGLMITLHTPYVLAPLILRTNAWGRIIPILQMGKSSIEWYESRGKWAISGKKKIMSVNCWLVVWLLTWRDNVPCLSWCSFPLELSFYSLVVFWILTFSSNKEKYIQTCVCKADLGCIFEHSVKTLSQTIWGQVSMHASWLYFHT